MLFRSITFPKFSSKNSNNIFNVLICNKFASSNKAILSDLLICSNLANPLSSLSYCSEKVYSIVFSILFLFISLAEINKGVLPFSKKIRNYFLAKTVFPAFCSPVIIILLCFNISSSNSLSVSTSCFSTSSFSL